MGHRSRRNGRKRDRASGGLKLVSHGAEHRMARQDGAGPPMAPWQCEIGQEHLSRLVVTMMLRLEISRDASIVGLLGVGSSRDNEDELSKWVTRYLPEIDRRSWEEQVSRLCREFVLAIDDARGL